jgi:hypothetical protein
MYRHLRRFGFTKRHRPPTTPVAVKDAAKELAITSLYLIG